MASSMSTPLEQLYLENLEEYIYDDRKFVSFKWLSCKLGVHVNLAKQMLYQFMTLEASKTRKDRLHPIYYLSGRAPTAWIDSLDGDSTSPPPPPPEKKIVDPCLSPDLFAEFNEPEGVVEESFLVMLVKGEELEEYQTHFSQLFSLHLYGLSAYPMTKPLLDEFTATPIFDDKGRAPVHYGPITCPGAREYRPDPHIAIRLQHIAEVKKKVAEDKAKWEEKLAADKIKAEADAKKKKPDFFAPKNPDIKKAGTTSAAPKPSTSAGEGGAVGKQNRLKNMFAAVAAKPKVVLPPPPQKKEEPKKKVPVDSSSDEEEEKPPVKKASTSKSWSAKRKEEAAAAAKAAAAKKKKAASGGIKRKRIKDVFSSSSEEEDAGSDSDHGKRKNKATSSEDETFPESPIPKKYIAQSKITSDSDDDDFQDAPPKHMGAGSKPGRKRVLRTQPKRHIDEEGFLVTTMEQVMVSESDNSEGDELGVVEPPQQGSKTTKTKDETEKVKSGDKTGQGSSSSSSSGAGLSKATPKKKEGLPPPKKGGKGHQDPGKKQPSIMSFFQKR